MKLEFNDIGELKDFLQFAYDLGERLNNGTPARPTGGVSGSAGIVDSATGGDIGDGSTRTLTITPGGESARTADEIETEGRRALATETAVQAATVETQKRKRRTKAEIEADAAAVIAQAAEPATAQPQDANPFEQPGEPAAVDHTAAEAAHDEAADGATVVTPFQHLTRAREFIAKHGTSKYNESFTKAGLDANVMGYSAYQRSLHLAALDELEKA